MDVERSKSGLDVVKFKDNRGKKKPREQSPISALLSKLAVWLQQQPEWHEIQDIPRPIRKNLERDILKRVFRNLKDRDE